MSGTTGTSKGHMRIILTILLSITLWAEEKKPAPPEIPLELQNEMQAAINDISQAQNVYSSEFAKHMGPLEADIHRAEGRAQMVGARLQAICGKDLELQKVGIKYECGPPAPKNSAPAIAPMKAQPTEAPKVEPQKEEPKK